MGREAAVGVVGQGLGRDVGGEAAGILLEDFGDVAVGVVGEVIGSGVGSAVFFYAEQATDAACALKAPREVESPGVGLEEGVAAGGVVNGDQVAECSPKGRPPIRSCGRKQGLRHLRAPALRPAVQVKLRPRLPAAGRSLARLPSASWVRLLSASWVKVLTPAVRHWLSTLAVSFWLTLPEVVVGELDLFGSGGQRGNGPNLFQMILLEQSPGCERGHVDGLHLLQAIPLEGSPGGRPIPPTLRARLRRAIFALPRFVSCPSEVADGVTGEVAVGVPLVEPIVSIREAASGGAGPGKISRPHRLRREIAVGVVGQGFGPGGEVLVQRVGRIALADASDAGAEAVADGVKALIKGVGSDWTAGARRIPPAVAVGTDDATLAEHARHKPEIH